jgi:hypothetical protein
MNAGAHKAAARVPRAWTVACWLLTLWLSGCAALPTGPSGAPPPTFLAGLSGGRTPVVGVLIAGWHTGLVLPADELGLLRERLQHNPTARFASVGWGNRRFYMETHPSSGDALAALFPSSSALLVQAVANASDAVPADGRLEWLCADRDQLWKLDRYLIDSLRWRSGRPLDLGPGPLADSRFYASSARYDAFHDCNTWTVAALQFAGLPVTAAGVLFAGQVARRIQALPACPLPAR